MLVEMELREIIRGRDVAAIVLGEKHGANREFPVYIDYIQAAALEMAVNGEQAPRPLTHDLVLNVVSGMGGTLKRIIVDKLVTDELGNGTFYAKLDIVRSDHSSAWIDARPSDAVVLASKLHLPIYVDEEVLREVKARPAEEAEGQEFEESEDDTADPGETEEEDT